MSAWFKASMIVIGLGVIACEGVENSRIDPGVAVGGDDFRPVAQVLVDRCGALDCHGSKYRNMRLYGFGSARLDPNHHPDAPDTTDQEVQTDYESVLALEPDLVLTVLAERGENPERLTFIRKATNQEAHKGGRRITKGDDADLCLRSWLAGTVDRSRCRDAVPRLKNP